MILIESQRTSSTFASKTDEIEVSTVQMSGKMKDFCQRLHAGATLNKIKEKHVHPESIHPDTKDPENACLGSVGQSSYADATLDSMRMSFPRLATPPRFFKHPFLLCGPGLSVSFRWPQL